MKYYMVFSLEQSLGNSEAWMKVFMTGLLPLVEPEEPGPRVPL